MANTMMPTKEVTQVRGWIQRMNWKMQKWMQGRYGQAFVLPLDVIGSSFNGEVYSLHVKHTTPAGPTVDPNLKK